MVRLRGVDLAKEKKVKYALTSIYGIGVSRAENILEKCGLSYIEGKGLRVKDLSDDDISNLRKVVEKDYQLESDLVRLNQLNLKRLMENGCIKGRRHRAGLPVRGQRTRTNSRTKRKAIKSVTMKKK
uniref:Small ribosomal subunit protein uS13c n=1 Tax=Dictyopteris divaricata TaxID=156996 RepID=A0A2I4Q2I5_9PHAE|nr:30S ribosomal protein S13 [Dictyopteris divaricata]AQZ25061.1 30S ribosomal protein S13 [Dictyopteris divaricata]